MSKYIGIFVFVFSLFSLGVHAGESFRFRVYLKDKGDSGYTLDNPEEYLSKESVERRNRQGISVSESDLPPARPARPSPASRRLPARSTARCCWAAPWQKAPPSSASSRPCSSSSSVKGGVPNAGLPSFHHCVHRDQSGGALSDFEKGSVRPGEYRAGGSGGPGQAGDRLRRGQQPPGGGLQERV